MIKFETATPDDADILAEVSKRAFHSDINCGATGEGGPPGYDSPEWQVNMMSNKRVIYSKILYGDKIIGGFLVFVRGPGYYELGRMFVDPDFQNQGIGTKTFEYIWEEFPEAKKWILETPIWNRRTRHFYEKVGFKVKEVTGDSVHFEKLIKEPPL